MVRFAAELGYDGYPAMQKALQEMIRSKLTSVQRIEVSNAPGPMRRSCSKISLVDVALTMVTLSKIRLK